MFPSTISPHHANIVLLSGKLSLSRDDFDYPSLDYIISYDININQTLVRQLFGKVFLVEYFALSIA